MLRAALEVGGDARGLQRRLQLGDRTLDEAFAALAPRVEELRELPEPLRLDDLEREILELPLHLPDSEAFRERGIDLEGLARDPALLLRWQRGQRAHVVEAVGELDEDDADVLRHREEHFSDVLGLLLLVRERAELAELRHAIDKVRDLLAEAFLDVREAELGVFGNVVEERGLDRDRVEAELGEDLGRGDRVRDEGLARGADLAAVRLDRERHGVADPGRVDLGIGLLDGLQELSLQGLDRWLGGLRGRLAGFRWRLWRLGAVVRGARPRPGRRTRRARPVRRFVFCSRRNHPGESLSAGSRTTTLD